MNFTDFNEHTSLNTLYLELYNISQNILDKKLDYFSQSKYSVDIYKLASVYNIDICEKYIPPLSDSHIEILGYLNTYSGKTIYLNTTTGHLTRRYTIAYNLAYYLFQGNNNTEFTYYFTNSVLPTDLKEHFCHILTSFLLMPINSVMKIMSQYAESNALSKITFHSWLDYLGNIMGLPSCYTAIAFENIKALYTILPSQHI